MYKRQILYDAGDIRNKSIIDTITNHNMPDTNVLSMFKKKKRKLAIIMDEIDGMNNGDKGGIGSLINSFFGTVSSCLTGPVTGIIVSDDDNKNNVKVADANKLIGKERVQLLIEKHGKENFIEGIKEFKKKSAINGHYTSGIIFAFLFITFGTFSPFFTGFISCLLYTSPSTRD